MPLFRSEELDLPQDDTSRPGQAAQGKSKRPRSSSYRNLSVPLSRKMSSSHDADWQRLVRYLSGEHAPGEKESLQAWILEDGARARLMDELGHVWEATGKSPAPRDTEAAWQKLSAKLQAGELETEGERRRPDAPADEEGKSQSVRPGKVERSRLRQARAQRHSRAGRLRAGWRGSLRRRATATVTVLAAATLLAAFLLWQVPHLPSAGEAQVFTTKRGQRATVRLSDGTQVRLNVESRLTLSAGFDVGEREVRLEGEAYFDVARDVGRPFLVRTKGATVRVLGTAFDVRAYAGDEGVQVAVAEGEVSLRPAPEPPGAGAPEGQPATARSSAAPSSSARQDTVLLRARQLGVVSGLHVQAVRQGVNLSRQLAWTKGQLVFEDAPFGEVVRMLGRWYGLRVEAAPHLAPEAVDRLNATFEDESLREALEAVAAALELQYKRSGRTVVFYRKGRSPARSA